MIGMSALLTTTIEEQKKLITASRTRASPRRPEVGGAPATRRWADQIGRRRLRRGRQHGVEKINELLGV